MDAVQADYRQDVRIGQTGRGSFVATILSPVLRDFAPARRTC